MKKAASIFVILIFCLSFAGCSTIGNQNSDNLSVIEPLASTEQQEETTSEEPLISTEQQSKTTSSRRTSVRKCSGNYKTTDTQANHSKSSVTSSTSRQSATSDSTTTQSTTHTQSNNSQLSTTGVSQNTSLQYNHIAHDSTQIYEWKCDIPPTQIKEYDGSPIEGFFITVDDVLYEYNAQEIFPESGKNYRKIDTDLKMLYISYHFQMNRLVVLSDDFQTYTYDKAENAFVKVDHEFGGIVKEISKNNTIISWSALNSYRTTVWFIDEKGDVYSVKQTDGTEYTQSLLCTMPSKEKILFADTGVIKTENGYYCFDQKQSRFLLAEEPTAVYDNIAFLNHIIIMYKDDPTHIYDHKLLYEVKFSYY